MSRARICDWTSKVKGSYLRLDIKGPESMPDGMGCHLPMKLRGQNSRSQRKTRIQFSCIPKVAPRYRGNDCQIRWSVSVGSLFISTVASVVSSSSDSKTLLLLPWLPLLPWPPKILKKTFVNKQLEPKTQSFLAACCGLSQVTGRGRTPHQAKREEVRHSLRRCFHWSFHRWFEPFHLRISHVILCDVFYGFRGDVTLMIVHILLFGSASMATVSGTSSCSSRTSSKSCPAACN